MRTRVQHPELHEARKSKRDGWWWFFRYWKDEIQSDGSLREIRMRQWIGPSRGDHKIPKKDAEVSRDRFLERLNGLAPAERTEEGAILFGKLAEMWRDDYVLKPKFKLAASTKQKYLNHLENHILPRWKDTRIDDFRAKDVLDWLCDALRFLVHDGGSPQHSGRHLRESAGVGNHR